MQNIFLRGPLLLATAERRTGLQVQRIACLFTWPYAGTSSSVKQNFDASFPVISLGREELGP